VDNIKINLGEIGWGGMDWIRLTQDMNKWKALMNTVMNLWVPYSTRNFLSNCTNGGFSITAQLHEISYFVNTYLKYVQYYVLGNKVV
jgi:hypothetical protein